MLFSLLGDEYNNFQKKCKVDLLCVEISPQSSFYIRLPKYGRVIHVSYGDSLQQLLKVPLLSGKKSMEVSQMQQEETGDVMDFEPPSLDNTDVTLNIPDPSTLQELDNPSIDSSDEYQAFVGEVKEQLQEALEHHGNQSISWNTFSKSEKRREAALNFQHLLQSVCQRDFCVSQESPYGDISISLEK